MLISGTKIGDPAEINGLKRAFSGVFEKKGIIPPQTAYCGIGSVKTNIGHLETAAGIAGVIKVMLSNTPSHLSLCQGEILDRKDRAGKVGSKSGGCGLG